RAALDPSATIGASRPDIRPWVPLPRCLEPHPQADSRIDVLRRSITAHHAAVDIGKSFPHLDPSIRTAAPVGASAPSETQIVWLFFEDASERAGKRERTPV